MVSFSLFRDFSLIRFSELVRSAFCCQKLVFGVQE